MQRQPHCTAQHNTGLTRPQELLTARGVPVERVTPAWPWREHRRSHGRVAQPRRRAQHAAEARRARRPGRRAQRRAQAGAARRNVRLRLTDHERVPRARRLRTHAA